MAVRVIIDSAAPAGRNGEAYYRMFPREPSAIHEWDMEIDPDNIVCIGDGITLLKLLEEMNAPPFQSVILLLTHGTVEGANDGMVMPVGPALRGQRAASATNAALQAIADCDRNPDTLAEVAEQVLKVSQETLASILALRRQLQGRIERLEFRACNLGKLGYVLEGIRQFLGAGHVLAPKSFMLYGKVDPVVAFPDSSFRQWVETNQGPAVSAAYQSTDAPAEVRFQYSFLSTQVTCVVDPDQPGAGDRITVPIAWRDACADTFFLKIWEAAREPRHEWAIEAAARTPQDIRPWIDHYVYPKSSYSSGPFYVAAIWTFGVLDRPYVLPMDLDYRSMIGCSPSL